MPNFDLSGRTALITGSSKGIGYALAQGLGQAGARLVLNARGVTALEEAAERLQDEGFEVDLLPFDVTDVQAVRAAIDTYDAQHPIDILVNNAGMTHRAPLEEFAPEDFDRIMRTNVYSAFYVGQAVARHMIARGRGKIINIASVQTSLARPSITPYTTSKGAIANMTKGMATEWARKGLNCNAIAPGYFETELTAALVADPDFTAWLKARTPQGRWGQVEELQGAAVFLASDASGFVNGHVLYVDGGMTVSV